MRDRRVTVVTLALALLGACARPSVDDHQPAQSTRASPSSGSVRIVLGGDVMLGRAVAPVWRTDPAAPFAGIRATLLLADVAAANLESPLTARPHRVGPDALEADPAAAGLLAAAGFDAMSIANNHAADAGPATVADTTAALAAAGVEAIGTGGPVIVRREGLAVGFLAFDATWPGTDGVATWDPAAARGAVANLRARADVTAVSLHGGTPYGEVVDPYLARQARRLARWGVDVVWCHGPHVAQPVRAIDPDGDGRATVIATSLGNLLFDQGSRERTRGALLEIRADAGGVVAYRLGRTEIGHGAVDLVGWRPPRGDAVAFDGTWWTPVRTVRPVAPRAPRARLLEGLDASWDVERAVLGDADGDRGVELVVVARVAYRPWPVHAAYDRPGALFVDREGRLARVAVYDRGLRPRWIASLIARPLAEVAACGGALSVSYRTLDDPRVTGTGLWVWTSFGYAAPVDLPGPGVPGCADVDGNGRAEPVVTGRDQR